MCRRFRADARRCVKEKGTSGVDVECRGTVVFAAFRFPFVFGTGTDAFSFLLGKTGVSGGRTRTVSGLAKYAKSKMKNGVGAIQSPWGLGSRGPRGSRHFLPAVTASVWNVIHREVIEMWWQGQGIICIFVWPTGARVF